MSKSIMERLGNYFQDISEVLAGDKSASSIFPNSSDIGMTREDVLKHFLDNHLPKRCEVVKGGFIFDKQGQESKQLDLIVTNDLTLQFKQFDKSFNCIEGCNAVVSVKSNLDKKELFDALDNIASIPPMPGEAINYIDRFIGNREKILNYPIKIIFAYEGLTVGTIMDHIQSYYMVNKILHNLRPHMIIVNNKYMISRIGEEGGSTRNGEKIAPNTFYPISNFPNVGAYSLFYMVNKIQAAANINSHMLFNFNDYLDRVPF